MALKDYPEWVLTHKEKGKEIRFLNGRYYLYLYHNEKIDGVSKKITDQYLGRITEVGLVPPVEKSITYVVLLYGLTAFIFSSCETIVKGLVKRYPTRHSKLLQLAILYYFFNNDINEFNLHYISIIFPYPILKKEKDSIQDEINRIVSMFHHTVTKSLLGLSLDEFKSLIIPIYIVGVKDKWTTALIDEATQSVIEKYNINLEIKYGKD
jgi:hypothetical protein